MSQRTFASQREVQKYGRKSRSELFGVDAKHGTVHSVVTTAANVADSRVLPELLHGGVRKVWGDSGYPGQSEAIKQVAPRAQT